MAVTAAVGLFMGVALAQFFRAYILPPATMLALIFAVIADLADGRSLIHVLVACLFVAFALQVGYLLGALLRGFVVPAEPHSFTAGSVGLRSRLPASLRRR
jgi:hypothetical protein